MKAAAIAAVLSLCMTVAALGAEPDDLTFSASQIEFFEQRIRPILVQRCYECHSSTVKKLRGGLRLDSRAAVVRGGDTGPAIAGKNVDASLLIQAIRYDDEDLQMPPAGKLPDREIAALVKWVELGAPMPIAEIPSPNEGRKIDFAEGRKFWSFQPAAPQQIPPVKQTDWPRSRIDYFVLAEMEKRGLAPTPPADRRTLIRRATFDLTGLPPTPDEVAAFVHDTSPDACERLIDRLLASPHYGERWGRFWLDLARYTDVTAGWLKSTAKAYLYRDWVVQAMNDDVPYDDFVKRQIATDLMPQTGLDDLPALGFFGLSPTYWKELKLDKEVIKMVVAEEWEERIDALGRTFLGLTLACARCHDHKFDPISAEDYYALAGVFASTRLVDQPIVSADVMERSKQARHQIKLIEESIATFESNKPLSQEVTDKIKELRAQIVEIERTTPHLQIPIAHVLDDASIYVVAKGTDSTKIEYKSGEARDIHVHVRGNPSNPGNLVPRRFLTVLSNESPRPFQHGSGRLELARAIFQEGRPLAARVIVNRIWTQHFGRGLVDTPSNFGQQGARPSHPALLDDLAVRFATDSANDWSLKSLHREIMLSATYRQASRFDAKKNELDPDNRWLWRMNRRRLDIESWRDAMLAVSGRLNLRIGGPSVELADSTNRRRTIYGKVHRRDINNVLRMFDFPDPTGHSPKREATTTPLQQLFVLNSDFVRLQADALQARMMREVPSDFPRRVRQTYQLLFGHDPHDDYMEVALQFLNGKTDQPTSEATWSQYYHALLGSNAFMFVD